MNDAPTIPDGLTEALAALNLSISGTTVSENHAFFVYFQYTPTPEQAALNVFQGTDGDFFDVTWDSLEEDFTANDGDQAILLIDKATTLGLDPEKFRNTVLAVMHHFIDVIEHATAVAATALNQESQS